MKNHHVRKWLNTILAAAMLAGTFSAVQAEETAETEESEWTVSEEAAYVPESVETMETPDVSVNASTSVVALSAIYYQDDARSMLAKINAFRTGSEAWAWNSSNTQKVYYNNLSALYYDYELEKAAMQRAAEISLEFAHDRPDGSYCTTAYNPAFNNSWRGECIAIGYGSMESCFNRWKEDDYDYAGQAHRRNMLSPNFRSVGIACAYVDGSICWVQEFSSIRVGTTPITYDQNPRTVNINILSSRGSFSGTFAKSALNKDPSMIVEIGYPVVVPTVNTTFLYRGYALYNPAVGTAVRSSNTSVLKIENNKMVGVKPGTATVTIEKTCGSYKVTKQLKITVRNHIHDFRFDWTWADDYSSASADYVCTVDDTHAGHADAVITVSTKEPTCYEDGITTYTATLTIEGTEYSREKYVLIPKTNDHNYAEPEFTWSADHSTASAYTVCANGKEELSETVSTSYEVIKEPTADQTGTGRFIAEFENEIFGTQYLETEIPVRDENAPTSFAITQESVNLKYNGTVTLKTSIYPAGASPEIIWTSSNMDVATVDQNGKVTGLRAGTAVITAYTLYGHSDTCEIKVLFTDVADAAKYYYDPVYWAADRDITVGYGGAGLFSPDAYCRREQIVTFLWRLFGEPEPEVLADFVDVKPDDWYFKSVSWAAQEGITVGLNDGTGRFGVGDPCTREQCVTFLYRAAGEPYVWSRYYFSDVSSDKYYYLPINWAYSHGITVGLNDGTGRFGVGQTCTRAMIVTFLKRYADEYWD